ncbi:hypothetical protein [Methanoregula sp.]|uniref:hypothetical protein n=1 Tax=Methanoregula sp. TaxID=2052170 RepID=UPI002BDCA38F|nr:hypothetical protein [Methanoregula sp.]HVP97014.1 hypothetical protein [Methanoregula sp.]
MCLCLQPYRHNTRLCADDPIPDRDTEDALPELKGADILTDNHGLTYMSVRNCDLDRFSAK